LRERRGPAGSSFTTMEVNRLGILFVQLSPDIAIDRKETRHMGDLRHRDEELSKKRLASV
jgi:hypothetical protein